MAEWNPQEVACALDVRVCHLPFFFFPSRTPPSPPKTTTPFYSPPRPLADLNDPAHRGAERLFFIARSAPPHHFIGEVTMRLISDAVTTEIIEQQNAAPAPESFRRRDMIEQIVRINATATADFLNRFADAALQVYLDHLTCTQQPRGRRAVWVRPGDTAAANTATPA
jgi:hypothetical protein